MVGGAITFGNGFDVNNFHIAGTDISLGGKLNVNGSDFTIADLDGDASNGYELSIWKRDGSTFTYDSSTANFTLTGSAFADTNNDNAPDNVTVSGNTIKFGSGFDVNDFHVSGTGLALATNVTVNGKSYTLAQLDGDTDNGFELSTWSKSGSTYTYSDSAVFTLSGSAFTDANNDGAPVTFGNGFDVGNFHIAGTNINLGGKLNVNGSDFSIADLDGDSSNGHELSIWKRDGSTFTYDSSTANFTLNGSAFVDDNGDFAPDNVTVKGSSITFGSGFDVDDFHVSGTGLALASTVTVNGRDYTLAQLDGDTDNGFELSAWSVSGSTYTYSDTAVFTLSGSAFTDANNDGAPDNVSVVGGAITFGNGFDVNNFHIAGRRQAQRQQHRFHHRRSRRQ